VRFVGCIVSVQVTVALTPEPRSPGVATHSITASISAPSGAFSKASPGSVPVVVITEGAAGGSDRSPAPSLLSASLSELDRTINILFNSSVAGASVGPSGSVQCVAMGVLARSTLLSLAGKDAASIPQLMCSWTSASSLQVMPV
jgi:hypothetical protein